MPRMSNEMRELYGREVRHVWMQWAKEQPNPKPSWLVDWDVLTEAEREVDRRIGEALVNLAESHFTHAPGRALFQLGKVTLHSGQTSNFKIECDNLSEVDLETLAYLIAKRFRFGEVYGIPTGGDRLAKILECYASWGPTLLVDDVLTTGASMEKARRDLGPDRKVIGVVLFARSKPAPWIHAVFQMWDRP